MIGVPAAAAAAAAATATAASCLTRRLAGVGAFKSVYKGTWRGKPVAVLMLHPTRVGGAAGAAAASRAAANGGAAGGESATESLAREAAVFAAAGDHPNLIAFHGEEPTSEPSSYSCSRPQRTVDSRP